MSWALTLIGLFAAYATVCALGFASFPNQDFVRKTASALGMAGAPAPVIVLSHAAVAATVGLVNAAGRALGEELGWRGLFVPEACTKLGFLPGAVFVSVVWALWHFPLLLGDVPIVGS